MPPTASFWKGKSVCVTGGTGFLGFHLVRQLLDLGADVSILAFPPKPGHPLESMRVDGYYGDLVNPTLAKAALRDRDVVFHTAGPVAVWGPALKTMVEQHCRGAQTVLDLAAPNATVVHTSSIVAIGARQQPSPVDENFVFNLERLPVQYVKAKRASEELVLAHASRRRVLVVNPGYLIGPDDFGGSIMGRMFIRFWKGRLFSAPRSGYNIVDVRDVATGHLLAAELGQSGRRYILGGENFQFASFLRLLAEVADMQPRGIVPLPRWFMHLSAVLAERRSRRTGREAYPSVQQTLVNRYFWFVNSDRAHNELGWSARPVRQSVEETYDWYRRQQILSLRGFNKWWMRPKAA